MNNLKIFVAVLGLGFCFVASADKPAADKVEASKAIRMQRNIARVQKVNNYIVSLQLQASQALNEVAGETEELRAFCKDFHLDYNEVANGVVWVADDGTIKRSQAQATQAQQPAVPVAPSTKPVAEAKKKP
jgi:hypothetical protein